MRKGNRGGGLPPRDPRERAIAICLYEHSPIPVGEVSLLLGAPEGTISRWWRASDEERGGKPPHRGGSGCDPQDRAALAEAENAELRTQVKALMGKLASFEDPTGAANILAEAKVALRGAIGMAKAEAVGTLVRASIDLHRYQQEIGSADDKEARAAETRDYIDSRLCEITPPPLRPCDLGLVEDRVSDDV